MKKYLSNTLVVSLALCTLTGCAEKNGKTYASLVSIPVSSSLESSMPDSSFSSKEYKKLMALRFDGYEDMSISEYQNKVWALLDEPEYFYLLESFSKSSSLYECRDSDEMASFLFNVLEPITAEKWHAREFGGYAATDYPDRADNAVLEFCFTLTILDKDKLTVGEYDAARTGITNSLQDILQDKTEEQLQDESSMQTEIDMEIANITKQWSSEKLNIAVEYVYTPLSQPESDGHVQNALKEQERREYPSGTQEDYRSLMALKTPDYQNLPIADFNKKLLKWANENYERMERVNCDVSYNDFSVPLTADERCFVSLSVNLSGIENAKHIQSNYTGRVEEAPSYDCYLPQKTDEKNGSSAWCELYYQFSYQISNKETLTVGERDHCIGGMMTDIQRFWEKLDIDCLLEMEKEDVVKELQKIADSYSTELLAITIKEDQVAFERMDERFID